mmetsp:Transcript_13935/g.52263  ORF Transcript_13935/g.52263 Transcript_13935/m.52263 type:complete len:308 (+) Transcript_13935:329-1252(+)
MGIRACARWTRIWCVRPVKGRARTNAATRLSIFLSSVPDFSSSKCSRDKTAQTVSACFGAVASMSGWPPTLNFGSIGGTGCTHRASGIDTCGPMCASTVKVFEVFHSIETSSSPASPALPDVTPFSNRTTSPFGTFPTQSARYSFLARPCGPHSSGPRNCFANPSTNVASFTNKQTPEVSMSSRCTIRGASASQSAAPAVTSATVCSLDVFLSDVLFKSSRDFPRRTCPKHLDKSEFPSNLCVGWNRKPGGLFTTSSSWFSKITASALSSATSGMALEAFLSKALTRLSGRFIFWATSATGSRLSVA